MFEVKDNYLSSEIHIELKTLMESNNFPWYYNKNKVYNKNKLFHYQFAHIFYKNNDINSEFFHHLDPIIKKLKPYMIVKGGDYEQYQVVGNDICEIRIFNYVEGYSTTKILQNITSG